MDKLCGVWGSWLSKNGQKHLLRGENAYIGDGIKVAKDGRKMPGVKRLHQESANVNKPEWIRGHYFSALGLLLGAGQGRFVAPIKLKLHDGIESEPSQEPLTLVDKMAKLCVGVGQ